jgi:threonine/homoserine/homoserine lactone efflux protein
VHCTIPRANEGPPRAGGSRKEDPLEPALALRGFILGFTIAAAVGPISLLVIRRTLAEGRAVGLASGLGVATADATYGAIAAFGLGAISRALVEARPVLGLGGGLFLLWLAWATARAAPRDPAAAPARRGGLVGAYLSILGLTLTNPLTILSFGALFAGLGVTGGDAAGAALVTLGVLLGSSAWWVLLTTIVSAVRTRVTTVWIRRINVASGLAIGGFAVISIISVVR